MKIATTAIIILLSSYAAAQAPTLDDYWVGTEVGNRSHQASLLVQGTTIIFSNATDVFAGHFPTSNKLQTRGREIDRTAVIRIYQYLRRPPAARTHRNIPSTIQMRFKYSQHRLLMCHAQPGVRPVRKLNLYNAKGKAGKTRCYEFSRVSIDSPTSIQQSHSCIEQCKRRNMARAESHKKIEADCKRHCSRR